MCKKNDKNPQRPPLRPAATAEHGLSPTLIRARADYDHSSLLAWSFAILCTTSFILGPLILVSPLLVFPFHPRVAGTLLCFAVFLAVHPVSPWPRFRKACQVLYSVFDFHHNFAPGMNEIEVKQNRLTIVAMHPHAIIPIQGYLWVAVCDQVLPYFYGYGSTTDQALLLPILRHMLLWFGSGPASKKCLLREMQKDDQHLYILPGGVAEIFLSRRRAHPEDTTLPNTQTIKARRYGLMKLALQTGACIRPTFVFGASDMLDQVAPAPMEESEEGGASGVKKKRTLRDTVGGAIQRLSRKLGGGVAPFYGQYLLPVPHAPRLSMVMGDPIFPVANDACTTKNVSGEKFTCKRVEDPTPEQVEELMGRYVDAMRRLFEQYKAEAGYPNETLVIV